MFVDILLITFRQPFIVFSALWEQSKGLKTDKEQSDMFSSKIWINHTISKTYYFAVRSTLITKEKQTLKYILKSYYAGTCETDLDILHIQNESHLM